MGTLFTRLFFLVCTIICFIPPHTIHAGEKKTIAFAQDNMSYSWKRAQINDLEKKFSQHPEIDFIYSDGEGVATKQILNIENFIDQQVDLVIVSPVDYILTSYVIEKLYEAGIPVVYAIRRAVNENFTSYIHPEDYDIAEQAAQFIVRKLPAAKIMMLEGVPRANTVKKRRDGFLNEINRHENAEVIAIKVGDYTRTGAMRAMDDILEQNLEFNAIYAHSDEMLIGVRTALKANNINPSRFITVGIDYTPDARQAILTGEQTASLTYPISSKEIVTTCINILNGVEVQRHQVVPSVLITKDNAANIETIFD